MIKIEINTCSFPNHVYYHQSDINCASIGMNLWMVEFCNQIIENPNYIEY